ncbi:MAG: M20/M25/M40 family metallo-hydrolase, partial [Deinococcus-Thermus bacterium]|nr:M20/M25/M40 family metallo-hydrolase [Deinococcota bacterium]
ARLAGHGVAGKVAYGTEAGLFTEWLGVPAVVCGPGDIAQAHKPDESIAAEQLAACERFVDRLIDAAGRPA